MAFDIRWIGQGGFIVAFGGKKLCIDPYLSNTMTNGGTFKRIAPIPVLPEEVGADIILCTHNHMDHLDEATIKATDWNKTVYAGPDSCINHFKSIGIPDGRLKVFNAGSSMKLGDAEITGVFAEHTPDSIGLIVKYNGICIYFTGDSLYNQKLVSAAQYNPDILVCCINGKLGNMNYLEAAELARQIGVKTAIPCHYGMFNENTENPDNFKKALQGSGIRYLELEYGASQGTVL